MEYNEYGKPVLSDEEKEIKEAGDEAYDGLISYERLTGTMS